MIKKLIIILSVVGLFIASYLWWQEATGGDVCALEGCNKVLSSPHSHFLGIPVAAFGVFGYIILLVLSIADLTEKWNKKYLSFFIFLVSLFGFLVSVYLTYLELYVIFAICRWCVASAVTMTLIFLLSSKECTTMLKYKRRKHNETQR